MLTHPFMAFPTQFSLCNSVTEPQQHVKTRPDVCEDF